MLVTNKHNSRRKI